MPVFPLRTIEWPGSSVELKVIQPAHRRLYEDLLLSGKRRVVAPLARLPGMAPPEEGQLQSIGSVLQLEELREVSTRTAGAVKYIARHSVVGRAKILQLLNPSALFETDTYGAKVHYLRAEVSIVDEPKMEIVQTTTARELINTWDELRSISERLDEPRFESKEAIKRCTLMGSSWQVADVWQRLQIALRAHRERAGVHSALHEFFADRGAGPPPGGLPALAAAGAPPELLAALARIQDGPELCGNFWAPLLGVLAAAGAERRRGLLLERAREEVRLARARAAVRELLG